MATQIHETPKPTETEALLAREFLSDIDQLLDAGRSDLRLCLFRAGTTGPEIPLPAFAVRILKDILAEVAQGHAVALFPVHAELTTQQAADLLNVSRPYLIGLLEEGQIPFRRVGQHRRVRFDDLMTFKRQDDESRHRIADDLTADAQEPGMGY